MIATIVGYSLSLLTLLTIWCMGVERTRHLGFTLGFISQLIWIWYVTQLVYQPALLLLEIPLLVIYARHIWRGD